MVDNLCNSSEKSLQRVEKITGKKVPFYKADILDREALNAIFEKEKLIPASISQDSRRLASLLPSRGNIM